MMMMMMMNYVKRGAGRGSDVNKDWACKDKDKDKDQAHKDQDKDKDFTYSYLLHVAAKPTIAIKQQQWTQSESSQHMTENPLH